MAKLALLNHGASPERVALGLAAAHRILDEYQLTPEQAFEDHGAMARHEAECAALAACFPDGLIPFAARLALVE